MASLFLGSKIRMRSGYDIPVLGYGVYQTPHAVCEEVVAHALGVGYRHVDSAAAYRNERFCSNGITRSGTSRDNVFFTSKIPPKGLSYQRTQSQIDETLKETGMDYIDLMLIHSPYGGSANRKGAWKALVEAQEAGKIRSLGVSNYGIHHLDELEGHIKELEVERGKGGGGVLSVLQVELHPWLPRHDIVQWCQGRGIILEAYSPLIRGERMHESILKPLMDKHHKTGAQVLLRWSLQKDARAGLYLPTIRLEDPLTSLQGFVPLPKSATQSRIEENAILFDFELTEQDMASLEMNSYSPCAWDPTVASLES